MVPKKKKKSKIAKSLNLEKYDSAKHSIFKFEPKEKKFKKWPVSKP